MGSRRWDSHWIVPCALEHGGSPSLGGLPSARSPGDARCGATTPAFPLYSSRFHRIKIIAL